MNTFMHYGQSLNADNLYDACIEAVTVSPMVPMALYPMHGEQWLTDLIDALEGHPLSVLLDKALVRILKTLPASEIEVLANVIDSRHGHVPEHEVLAALAIFGGASATSRSSFARVISTALLQGKLAYTTKIRNYSKQPCTRNWLAAAFLCLDHEWTMRQLANWLENDKEDMLMSCMLGPLTHGELLALRDEVVDNNVDLSTHQCKKIEQLVERINNLPEFINRGSTIRWRT